MSVVTRIRTSQEVTVPFTPEEVWTVLADVAEYPRWWPTKLAVEILHDPGELLGAELEVRPLMGRMFRIRFEELEDRCSMRLRFFGGSLEGPGGFHLRDADGATDVRFEMDVFARGLDVAAMSLVLPLESFHRARMRSVLKSLAGRLKALRRTSEREAANGARLLDRDAIHLAEQDAAAEPVDQEPESPRDTNFEIARRYLSALSGSAPPEAIGGFFAPEAVDEEFPNRFRETAITRGFDGILQARAHALARFASQSYELAGATGGGSSVAMEVRWKGTVATTGGGVVEGQELEARIAVFLKFAGGMIVRQRMYPCFEPWSTRAERVLTLDERVALAGRSTEAALQAPAHRPLPPQGSNFDIARRYLEALGSRADAETIALYYAADAVQDEFPNRFLPGGAHRDLPAIKLARSRGLLFMASESYELLGATGGGSRVAIEVGWSGVVGQGPGLFTSGQRLEARLGIFLKFRDGLIVTQRNYDCT